MTQPTLESYPYITYQAVAVDGSRCWIAAHPDLPGCEVHAESEQRALQLLDEARIGYLKALDAMHSERPVPGAGPASRIIWAMLDPDRTVAGVEPTMQLVPAC